MDVFAVLKVVSIVAGIVSGGAGAVAAFPEAKAAINELKKDTTPTDVQVTEEKEA